jgi:hypothetical protein
LNEQGGRGPVLEPDVTVSVFLRRCVLFAAGALGALGVSLQAQAQPYEGPPVQVGRLADVQGEVWVFDADEGAWTAAQRNRPLVQGDRLSVDDDGRAEIRIGPTVLRLDGGTEIELQVLDADRLRLELLRGALALRVPTGEHARQTEVLTAEGRFEPLRAGHYRFDREDDVTLAGAWRGELQFSGRDNVLRIEEGERYRVWEEDRRGYARTRAVSMPSDRLAAWALASERSAPQSAAYRYVSPDMTGVEDLDRHGRWDDHPEFGVVWIPYAVPVGWAPYQDGRWVWMRPWGWTWVDAAPWGFAPFHYGRWVRWHGRWAWWPGRRDVRPVFAPALVVGVSGPQVGVSITIDLGSRHAPPSAWAPLPPYSPYVPSYRPLPPPPGHWRRPPPPPRRHLPPSPRPPLPPPQVPTGPISYGSDGVPSGVQVVPSNALRPVPVAPAAPTAAERPPRPERVERPERPGRADRPERPERPGSPAEPAARRAPLPQERPGTSPARTADRDDEGTRVRPLVQREESAARETRPEPPQRRDTRFEAREDQRRREQAR